MLVKFVVVLTGKVRKIGTDRLIASKNIRKM